MKKYMLAVLIVIFFAPLCFAGDSLKTFRTQIDYLWGQTSDPAFPDSVKNLFINDAFKQIVALVGGQAPCILKQDTIIVTSGTIQYSLETDFYATLSVHPQRMEYPALDYIPLWEAGRKPSGGTSTALRYEIAGGKILFDPSPTATDTVILFYNAYANTLSGANDTTNLPIQFRELVSYYAYAKGKVRVEQFGEANWAFSYFDQSLARLITILANQRYNLR